MVEASAAETEVISNAMAAAKACQVNGESEIMADRHSNIEATTPGVKQLALLTEVP